MASRNSLPGRARILLFDQLALLAVLLDDLEAASVPDELVVSVPVAGSENEPPRMRPDFLVLGAEEHQNLRAGLFLALAEEGRPRVAQVEIVDLLLQTLVGAAEGGFVLRGLFRRSLHALGLSHAANPKTRFQCPLIGDLRPMDADQERRARNEAIFREVNERIEELSRRSGIDEDDSLLPGFICECSTEGCTELLQLSYHQYEAVRQNPRRFLVLPGHQDLDVERVVDQLANALVVEKFSETSEVAVENDPRSDDPPEEP